MITYLTNKVLRTEGPMAAIQYLLREIRYLEKELQNYTELAVGYAYISNERQGEITRWVALTERATEQAEYWRSECHKYDSTGILRFALLKLLLGNRDCYSVEGESK